MTVPTATTTDDLSLLQCVLAQKDFVAFLRYVKVRSDDPDQPWAVRMEEWDYQVERAECWQAGESEIILKARQLGFSWLLAAYMLWRGSYFSWAIGYWSLNEDAAVHQLEERVLYIWERLPEKLKVPYRRRDRKVWFETGGSIDAHAATQTGGVSYTYQLVVFDEMALHREGKANWHAVEPTVSAGGQALICSTANPELGPSGFFYDLWRKSEDQKTGLKPVFVPWYARPGRDERWLALRRERHEASPESFDAFYPSSAAAAFVGRSGLVFPMFDPLLHVRATDPMTWIEYDYRAAGIDPGGGDPTALVVWGIYRDGRRADYIFHQPAGGELYRRGMVSIEEMVNWLSRWPRLNAVFCDTAGGSVIMQSLRQHGFPAKPANRDRGFGLNFYAALLGRQRLTHHESNEASIAEYASYRWTEKVNPTDKGRFKTATPVGEHADCLVAGTMIETERGLVPIEEVTISDRVLTRQGYCRVLSAWLNHPSAPTFRVMFSNGAMLTGTGEHPVWTEERGFTHLDALRYGDTIAPCNHSMATTIVGPGIRDTGTRRAGGIAALCTGMSGNSTTGQSLPALLSTTLTTTRTTTTSRTLPSCGEKSIVPIMEHSASEPLLKPSLVPQSGIAPRRVASGTESMGGRLTKHGPWCSTCASNAASPSSPRREEAGFDFATPIARHAPYVLAVGPTGMQEAVYNLTVERVPEFFANGVLVHNCKDATRYVLTGTAKTLYRKGAYSGATRASITWS